MVRKLLQQGSRISCSFSLILHESNGSKENIFDVKTLNQHSMFIIQPNQNLKLSESSASKDLQVYVHETANGEDRISAYLNLQWLDSCATALKPSRSSPSTVLWSFMHKEAIENPQIKLNFRTPSSCSSFGSARFWTELAKVMVDSCSKLHQDHESTKKLGVCVKNFEIRWERKLGGKWNFWSKFCYSFHLWLRFGLYMMC